MKSIHMFQPLAKGPRMLFHECANVIVIKWAWASEYEQIFLEYFVDVYKIFKEYSLTHTKYLMTWKNILSCVRGWMIFMDENVNDNWKWMNFFMNVINNFFWWKTKQKNRMKFFYVGLFWKIQHMKCWSHTLSHILY